MRIIFTLSLLTTTFTTVFAQDIYNTLQTPDQRVSDTPMLNYIYRLQYEIKSNIQQKNELATKVQATLNLLNAEKKTGRKDARMIKELYTRLNDAKESYYNLTNINKTKNDSLENAYLTIDNLKTTSKELQDVLDKYKREVNRLTKENAVSVNDLQRDIELMGLMLSGFSVFEIGTFKSGKMEVHKKYDSSAASSQDQEISFKNPDLLSQKMDVLNYNGMLCVPKTKSLGQHIPGEILIYVNEKLTYRLKDKLKLNIDNNISNIQCYEIRSRRKVNFDFPPRSNIRVGFISEETLRHLKDDDLSNFWETDEKGYFMISSLKSTYKLLSFSDSLLIKNSIIIDSINVKGSELTVEIYDNGIPDGDIASFYINGVLQIDKLGLKITPEKRQLTITEDVNILTLVANSQGDTSPCTAYVVVYEGNVRRGAITLSGTENKSHSIKIIRTNNKNIHNKH